MQEPHRYQCDKCQYRFSIFEKKTIGVKNHLAGGLGYDTTIDVCPNCGASYHYTEFDRNGDPVLWYRGASAMGFGTKGWHDKGK